MIKVKTILSTEFNLNSNTFSNDTRKMPLTFADYLNYEPESIHWEDDELLPGTPSPSTTKTSVPRIDGLKVKSWRSFQDKVKLFISNPPPPSSLVHAVIKGSLHQDDLYERYSVDSEANVSQLLRDDVFLPLERLFDSQETRVKINNPGRHCCLNPDYGISLSNLETPIYALKSLIEVKTPWAFPAVPDGDLAASFCQLQEGFQLKGLVERSSVSTKVIRVVTQLWGYMTVNHFRYGVLTTYLDTYFFFRRVEVDGQSCLEISSAVRNKGGDTNIMGARAYFILLLNQDPIYSSPYSTPEMKRRVIEQKVEDKYIPVGIALGDLYFEQKFSLGATGNVVLEDRESGQRNVPLMIALRMPLSLLTIQRCRMQKRSSARRSRHTSVWSHYKVKLSQHSKGPLFLRTLCM
jgi:hypothetical protein